MFFFVKLTAYLIAKVSTVFMWLYLFNVKNVTLILYAWLECRQVGGEKRLAAVPRFSSCHVYHWHACDHNALLLQHLPLWHSWGMFCWSFYKHVLVLLLATAFIISHGLRSKPGFVPPLCRYLFYYLFV